MTEQHKINNWGESDWGKHLRPYSSCHVCSIMIIIISSWPLFPVVSHNVPNQPIIYHTPFQIRLVISRSCCIREQPYRLYMQLDGNPPSRPSPYAWSPFPKHSKLSSDTLKQSQGLAQHQAVITYADYVCTSLLTCMHATCLPACSLG